MLRIELLSSVNRETQGFPAPVFLNKNGSNVLAIYQIVADKKNKVAAEIFVNHHGQLQTAFTIESDRKVSSGGATPDFSSISLLEEDATTARVRLLSPELTVKFEKTFDDGLDRGYNLIGGNFSLNGYLLNINYRVGEEITVVKILSGINLGTVSEIYLKGIITVSPVFFEHRKDTYLALILSSRLQIYRLLESQLLIVSDEELPQIASSLSLHYYSGYPFLIVGTRQAVLKDEFGANQIPENISKIYHDGDELRFYLFRKKLNLQSKMNFDTNIETALLLPNGKQMILGQSGRTESGYFNLVALHNDFTIKGWDAPIFTNSSMRAASSLGGKFVIVSSASNKDHRLQNIQLYRIKSL